MTLPTTATAIAVALHLQHIARHGEVEHSEGLVDVPTDDDAAQANTKSTLTRSASAMAMATSRTGTPGVFTFAATTARLHFTVQSSSPVNRHHLIIQYCPSHARHGGSNEWYLVLVQVRIQLLDYE